MADVNRGNRPLSPHLQIYRPHLTSVTSILTRITGNGLIVAVLLIMRTTLTHDVADAGDDSDDDNNGNDVDDAGADAGNNAL